MVQDPKILSSILEELIHRLQRCTQAGSDTVQDAEYTQKSAWERMSKARHSAKAIAERIQKDRLAVNEAREEVEQLLARTREAVETAQHTLTSVLDTKQTSVTTVCQPSTIGKKNCKQRSLGCSARRHD